MARTTDEIYVKIIADTHQATQGVKGFTDSIKGGLGPIRELSRALNLLFVAGGAGIILQRIARGLGDMQMAYEKLNPAAAKASGSLTNWNKVMERMKAFGGGVIDTVLNPIRALFIDLLDPMFKATQQLKDFSEWTDTVIKQYASGAFLAAMKYSQALQDQATAQEALNTAMSRSEGLQRALNRARAELAGISEPGPGTGMAATGASIARSQAQTKIDVAMNALTANSQIIGKAKTDLMVIADFVKTYLEGVKGGAGGGGGAAPNLITSLRPPSKAPPTDMDMMAMLRLQPQEVEKTSAAVAIINDEFEEMAQRASLVGHEWEGFDEAVRANLDTFTQLANSWSAVADSLVSGDVAGAFAKLGQMALAQLTNYALLAAAAAAAKFDWVTMAFWLGVAGVSILGSSALGTIPGQASGGGTVPSSFPMAGRSMTIINVQGSVISENQLGAMTLRSAGDY